MRLNMSTADSSGIDEGDKPSYLDLVVSNSRFTNRCDSPALENDLRRRDLIRSLFPNALDAQKFDNLIPKFIPPGIDMLAMLNEAKHMSPKEFYDAVRNRGKWDFKQIGPERGKYCEFGNFSYGLTSRAFGRGVIPGEVFLRGAGWAQDRAGTSKPEWGSWFSGTGTYGDAPDDQQWISSGMFIFDNRMPSVEFDDRMRAAEPSSDRTIQNYEFTIEFGTKP